MDSGHSLPASQSLPAIWRGPRRLFLLAIVLWCAIPLSPQSVDSDFWGHVQYGWDTWHYGLARTATYTYTAVGHSWINHENLSELIMAAGARGIGPSSLLVMKCLMGCVVLALGMKRAAALRPPVQPAIMAVVCVVTAINLSYYWGLRPHVFSFFFFALLVALTDWSFDGWSGHWHLPWPARTPSGRSPEINLRRLHALWLAPILLAIWANTHGGFLAGAAVFGTLLSCRGIELLMTRRGNWARVISYLIVLTSVGLLATLLNPYGVNLHRWLVHSLSVPRPEIHEWHPPAWWTLSSIPLWTMLGLMGWGLLASRRPRDLAQMVVLALVLAEACQHQRHIPFVAILFLFWLPAHLQSAVDRTLGTGTTIEWPRAPQFARGVTLCLLMACALLAYRVGTRLANVAVSNLEYPVDALQFMADHDLNGRLVVDGHWAQYALSVMGARTPADPGLTVAFDGRFRTCYPQTVVDMNFDFFVGRGGPERRYRSPSSPPTDPKRILEFQHPELVLLNHHQTHAGAIMQSVQDEWVLLYEDQLAQLWGRRSIYAQPNRPEYLPPEQRCIAAVVPRRTVPWPAAPQTNEAPELTLHTSARQTSQQARQTP